MLGSPPGVQVIRIRGGLPDNDDQASVGSLRLQREPGEREAAFEDRAIALASEMRAGFVVFGRLPDLDRQT